MIEQQALDVVSSIEPTLFWFFFKLFVAAVVALMFKRVLEDVASYTWFRFNKKLGEGIKIRVNGLDGVITRYNIRWIFIRVQGGNELLIPMRKWQDKEWTITDYYKDLYEVINGEGEEG